MSEWYRTSGVAAGGRFDYWRSLMRRHFALSSGRNHDDKAFSAELKVHHLGPVTVFGMTADWQCWTRARRHLLRDPHDEFVLTLMLSGNGSLRQAGREALQKPGVISVFDTSQGYAYEQCGETICLEIPRALLAERLQARVPVAVPFSNKTPIGNLFGLALCSVNDGELPEQRLIGASLIELAAALLTSGTAEPLTVETPAARTALERARAYIHDRLGDPSLSIASIARANGLSPRTLARLFATEGTTPMHWVWQERLAACHQALLREPCRRVTDIAFAAGFSSLSHFCRAFRYRYGVTPLEVRLRDVPDGH